MIALPEYQTLFAAPTWLEVRDGDPRALALYERHYSAHHYRDHRPKRLTFVGPGEKLVLLTPDGLALYAWRRSAFTDYEGINCTVFRNEGPRRSSDLIRVAAEHAWSRWPGERLYTFVDARKIRSTNPGYCFLMAGWRLTGRRTKDLGLIELEVTP